MAGGRVPGLYSAPGRCPDAGRSASSAGSSFPPGLTTLPGVLIATLPYSAVVSLAFAPLVLGVLTTAVLSKQAKAKRDRH